jgi:hypothetical protein
LRYGCCQSAHGLAFGLPLSQQKRETHKKGRNEDQQCLAALVVDNDGFNDQVTSGEALANMAVVLDEAIAKAYIWNKDPEETTKVRNRFIRLRRRLQAHIREVQASANPIIANESRNETVVPLGLSKPRP